MMECVAPDDRWILLLRHGQSTAQANRSSGGSLDHAEELDPPLSPQGVMQAERAGQRLAGLHLDRILVSPLERAYQTWRHTGLRAPEMRLCSLLLEHVWGPTATYGSYRPAGDRTGLARERWGAWDQPTQKRAADLAAEFLNHTPAGQVTLCISHFALCDRFMKHCFQVDHGPTPGLFRLDNTRLAVLQLTAAGRWLLRGWNLEAPPPTAPFLSTIRTRPDGSGRKKRRHQSPSTSSK